MNSPKLSDLEYIAELNEKIEAMEKKISDLQSQLSAENQAHELELERYKLEKDNELSQRLSSEQFMRSMEEFTILEQKDFLPSVIEFLKSVEIFIHDSFINFIPEIIEQIKKKYPQNTFSLFVSDSYRQFGTLFETSQIFESNKPNELKVVIDDAIEYDLSPESIKNLLTKHFSNRISHFIEA